MNASRSIHNDRRGFTLIELLVVIAIIAMLAAFSLAALFGAQQAAKEAATEGLISKLHSQMALRWETYETRRLPLVHDAAGGEDLDIFARRQLDARRELMRMELPDQYFDLPLKDESPFLAPVAYVQPNGAWIVSAVASSYLQRIRALATPNATNAQLNDLIAGTNFGLRDQNESAECLYMIMTTGMADENSGGEFFSERDIGDTDGDGMPEFIDAWGNPIEWIRWPAGFWSDLQPVVVEPLDLNIQVQSDSLLERGNRQADDRHDPFDLWRLDDTWFALFPLIMSPGRDEEYGIFFAHIKNLATYSGNGGDGSEYSDPYRTYKHKIPNTTDTVDLPRGAPLSADFGLGHQDNIHNHSIGSR